MKNLIFLLLGSALLGACSQSKPEPEAAAVEVKSQPVEFADAKYVEIGKQGLKSLAEGNIDAFMGDFAENAKFVWNNGDSLDGKAAIEQYWRDRRGKAIDTMTYVEDVWLTLKANEPPANFLPTGVYIFGWFTITVTYSNGNKMTQSIHHVYHLDASDKIDRVNQWVDRAPILAATAKKK